MEMEMETEMETETENWNGNSCTVVSNHWIGFTQTTSFSVGQKLNMLIQPITCSWALSGIFPWVSIGQKSCVYLISCNERLEEHLFITETNSQPWLKHNFIETELCYQLAHLLKLIKCACDLWPTLTQEQAIGTFSFCPTLKEVVLVSPVVLSSD